MEEEAGVAEQVVVEEHSGVEEGDVVVVDIEQDWALMGEQAVLRPGQDQDDVRLLAKVLLIQHPLL